MTRSVRFYALNIAFHFFCRKNAEFAFKTPFLNYFVIKIIMNILVSDKCINAFVV